MTTNVVFAPGSMERAATTRRVVFTPPDLRSEGRSQMLLSELIS